MEWEKISWELKKSSGIRWVIFVVLQLPRMTTEGAEKKHYKPSAIVISEERWQMPVASWDEEQKSLTALKLVCLWSVNGKKRFESATEHN